MTSIKKRPDGRYRARYRDDGGKEHARHFQRKTDAQQWLLNHLRLSYAFLEKCQHS